MPSLNRTVFISTSSSCSLLFKQHLCYVKTTAFYSIPNVSAMCLCRKYKRKSNIIQLNFACMVWHIVIMLSKIQKNVLEWGLNRFCANTYFPNILQVVCKTFFYPSHSTQTPFMSLARERVGWKFQNGKYTEKILIFFFKIRINSLLSFARYNIVVLWKKEVQDGSLLNF